MKHSKHTDGRRTVATILAKKLPVRVAKWICGNVDNRIADLRDSDLKNIANRINHFVIPSSDIKYHDMASAEVVRGGVDTSNVSSKTMESSLCPGLYFVGEVLDIDALTGGFNLQLALSTAVTCANDFKDYR